MATNLPNPGDPYLLSPQDVTKAEAIPGYTPGSTATATPTSTALIPKLSGGTMSTATAPAPNPAAGIGGSLAKIASSTPAAPMAAPASMSQSPSFSLDPSQNNPASSEPGSLSSDIFHPQGYDGTVMGYAGTTDTSGFGAASSPYPTGAQTLGGSMYPWLQGYQGQYTAPMSTEQNQGLQGISNYVGGGQNLGGAQNYLNNVIGGQYLTSQTNPYLQQIINSATGVKNYQDDLERQRIGSSMAAGGNALSGARAAAEGNYQNQSNDTFNTMMGNLLSQNYQYERGLQQQGVPLQLGLSNQVLGGNQDLMAAGSVPQQLSQNDLNAQYGDWLRQISGMQSAYNQPMQEAYNALGRGYSSGTANPQYGTSEASGVAALLASLFGGGGNNGGTGGGGLGGVLGNLISSLFGGGTGGTGSAPNSLPYDTGQSGNFDTSGMGGVGMIPGQLPYDTSQSGNFGMGSYNPQDYGGDMSWYYDPTNPNSPYYTGNSNGPVDQQGN